MNDHTTSITQAEVESAVAKLETFIAGLPSGEQAAVGAVLTALGTEHAACADEDVQGSGVLDWGVALASGVHRLIHGPPGSEGCTTAAISTPAGGGQQPHGRPSLF